jgi:hypothetical protein
LARFDKKTGQLKGFVIRDFGGIKVHRPTLLKTAGVDIDVLPDSCVVAESPDEVRRIFYEENRSDDVILTRLSVIGLQVVIPYSDSFSFTTLDPCAGSPLRWSWVGHGPKTLDSNGA